MAAIYPRLLPGYATEFNWAYSDRYPEMPDIQTGFAFSLYLLSRFGDQPRLQHFYEEAFLQAFPALLEEAADREDPASEAARCYTLRTMQRFAAPLGLIRPEAEGRDEIGLERYMISKTPLLDAAVQFRV